MIDLESCFLSVKQITVGFFDTLVYWPSFILYFLSCRICNLYALFSNAVTIPYLLSIPIFCGLLYKFRKRSWYHLLIPVGFMLASILLMRYQWFFASYKLVLVFISAVLVTVVICNNWYPVHKRIVLPILWSCVVGIPTLSLLVPYKFQICSHRMFLPAFPTGSIRFPLKMQISLWYMKQDKKYFFWDTVRL